MKKLLFLIISAIFLISTGCQKTGCTKSCAENYDSSAQEDNNTCKGCKNARADNYCPYADLSSSDCDCRGDGFLTLTNNGSSVHNIKIGGTSYGYLYPGQQKTYRVQAGSHTLEFEGGCSQSTFSITECGELGRICNGLSIIESE